MKRMLSEDSTYNQIFADVCDEVFDAIVGDGMIQAAEMSQRVKGYNPDWCADEFVYDDHYKEIERTAKKLADLITEDYFKYYS